MRSLWSLYKAARANDDDDTDLTALETNLDTLETKVDSHGGVLVGSNNMRVTNVATVPGVIPAAGTMVWDSTLKCALFSDATSFFTAEGSLAV